jgi:hypothetical protein
LADTVGDDALAYAQPWTAVLETNNPSDVTHEDLEDIADLLEEEVPQASIEIGYEDQHGAGVTAHEVLIFWVPSAEALRDGLYVALIASATSSLRKRFQRRHGERRPKSLTVYDASTGLPLRTWVLRDEESEPEEKHETDPMRRPMPRHRQRGRHRRD